MGCLITANGMMPDPRKIDAIVGMPMPTDVAGVRRLLGTVQYLGKFVQGRSELTAPLRELIRKDNEFDWSESHTKAVQAIHAKLNTAPVLRYYDVNKEVTIQADASMFGLGAALMQDGQPVCYASRSMTKTEQNYARIEKELLAIVFSCERFDDYIYGRTNVHVETDHKPLESIFKREIHSTPKRLQRMRLCLQKYTLDVSYKKGAEMYLADTLSRAFVEETRKDDSEDCPDEIYNIENTDEWVYSDSMWLPEEKLSEMKHAMRDDIVMQALYNAIQKDWHGSTNSEMLKPYAQFKNELILEDGLVFKADRLVVPRVMRRAIMELLHQ